MTLGVVVVCGFDGGGGVVCGGGGGVECDCVLGFGDSSCSFCPAF